MIQDKLTFISLLVVCCGAGGLVLFKIFDALSSVCFGSKLHKEDKPALLPQDLSCDYCKQDAVKHHRCGSCGAPVTFEWLERERLHRYVQFLQMHTYEDLSSLGVREIEC